MEIKLQFYRPEDKLPDTSRTVLVITAGGHYWSNVIFSAKFGLFNVSDDNTETAFDVMYWAELPEVEE